MRDREQVHLYLGHLGIERRHPDWAALVVMDHVLGSGPGFTSRITRRLRDELGWRPSVTVEQGLRRTVEWYLANRDWWQPLLDRDGVGERLGVA